MDSFIFFYEYKFKIYSEQLHNLFAFNVLTFIEALINTVIKSEVYTHMRIKRALIVLRTMHRTLMLYSVCGITLWRP